MEYHNQIVRGFSWNSGFKILSSLLTVAKIFFLARLLSPNDFGLFSLTMIALGVSEAATETGINTTIIQSKHSVSYFLDTAWIIAIVRGLLIAVVMLALGIFLANFLNKPELLFLISLASFVPIIKGFINPAIIKYYKDMAFFTDSIYRLSLIVSSSFLAVLIALVQRSAFALVWAIVFTAIFEVVISFIFPREKPKFNFIPSRAMTIFKNARWLNISALFSYLNENVDNFIIGLYSSTRNLGLYQNAYTISHKSYEIAKSVHHSTLPAFVKITDRKKLKRSSLKIILVTMLGIVALSLPLFLFPKFFILLILGNQWLETLPLLRLLLLAGFLQSFSALCYSIFLSRKRYFFMNSHLGFTVLVLILSLVFLLPRYELIGAVFAIFLSRVLSLPILFFGLKDSFES